MKSPNPYTIHPKHLRSANALRRDKSRDPAPTPPPQPSASTLRTTPRDFVNPVDYQHPYDSMSRFAKALALRYDANRTRHAYYRQLRLLHEHFALDPALIAETQLRDDFLFVKLEKHWKPKSILFLAAVSGALSEKLATAKGLRATVNGFTAVLHTWNQQLGFHPHIHCLVPGAGLDDRGRFVRVKDPDFLVHLPLLQAAFRQHLRELLHRHDWQVDPEVWAKEWGVHIQPAGNGASALKYLGNYVARTAISDARLVRVGEDTVTFRWKNRDAAHRTEICTLPGVEFVARYLRHVLPRGLRSVRYYGQTQAPDDVRLPEGHPRTLGRASRARRDVPLTAVEVGCCANLTVLPGLG